MDEKALELLRNASWDQIIPELLQYALSKVYQAHFYAISLVKGENPNIAAQDIVYGSINKVFSGTREWNHNEKDNLVMYLRSVIKSEIYHYYNNEKYKTTERVPTIRTSDSDDPVETETLQSDQPTPEEILENEEKIKQDEIMRDNILKKVEGNPELEEVVLCIMDGIIKPQEIAMKLSIDIESVYNRKKRLRRIFKELQDQVKKGDIK